MSRCDTQLRLRQKSLFYFLQIYIYIYVLVHIFQGFSKITGSLIFKMNLFFFGIRFLWAPWSQGPACHLHWTCRRRPGDDLGDFGVPWIGTLRYYIQWIGLRENLQESPIFNGKIYGFL